MKQIASVNRRNVCKLANDADASILPCYWSCARSFRGSSNFFSPVVCRRGHCGKAGWRRNRNANCDKKRSISTSCRSYRVHTRARAYFSAPTIKLSHRFGPFSRELCQPMAISVSLRYVAEKKVAKFSSEGGWLSNKGGTARNKCDE